jgi:hypothetical protein
MSKTKNVSGVGFFGLLYIVIISLKLIGKLSWSWWIVLAPVWLLFICGFVIIYVIIIRPLIQQSRCPHDEGIHETQACDAICNKCGANLGFIGTWREQNKNANARAL